VVRASRLKALELRECFEYSMIGEHRRIWLHAGAIFARNEQDKRGRRCDGEHPPLFLLGNRIPDFALPEALTARMTNAPGTPGTICPYSGILADDNELTHPDDLAAAKEVVAHAFQLPERTESGSAEPADRG